MHRTLSPAGAFWLAAFTYFIWGFTFLASRIAQDYGTPFVLLFWRFALAFALLNLLRLTGRFPVRMRGRRLWPALLAGLFEPVLYFPCEQYGLKLTSTSFSGVMVALIPLCSLVYGAVFLHEKATWRQVVFSVLSVAGVIVLAVYATGIGAGSFLGFLILLGTVFAGAGYIVACRACSGSFTAFERTYITCGMGAAAFGVLSVLEHRRSLHAPSRKPAPDRNGHTRRKTGFPQSLHRLFHIFAGFPQRLSFPLAFFERDRVRYAYAVRSYCAVRPGLVWYGWVRYGAPLLCCYVTRDKIYPQFRAQPAENQ